MMKNTAALLLLTSVLAVLLGTGQCQGKCGKNQVWNDCGSACPGTCEDVTNMGKPRFCTLQCVPGCFCKQGYVLKSDRCVPKETCPCHTNAQYKCGTTCPLTCDNYQNPPTCTEACVLGCHCDKGYVRFGDSGKCVLPKECAYKG